MSKIILLALGENLIRTTVAIGTHFPGRHQGIYPVDSSTETSIDFKDGHNLTAKERSAISECLREASTVIVLPGVNTLYKCIPEIKSIIPTFATVIQWKTPGVPFYDHEDVFVGWGALKDEYLSYVEENCHSDKPTSIQDFIVHIITTTQWKECEMFDSKMGLMFHFKA